MASSARRRVQSAATVAATPLYVATACVGPGAVLCASAGYWATLLRVYPGGAGAAAIGWLLLAAAAFLAVTTAAVLAAFATGAGAWAGRLRVAPLAALLAVLAGGSALLLALWAVTGDPGLAAPTSAAVAGAALAAAAVLAQRTPPPAWNLRRFGPAELQMIVAVGMAAALLCALLAQPWETAALVGVAEQPAWQLTTVSMAIGAGAGMLLLHALRRPGAGFMALLAAFGLRALLIGILQRPLGGFEGAAPALLLALAPAGLLDLFYLYNLPRGDAPRTAWLALTSAVTGALLGSLLVLERLVAYPPVTSATIPGIVVAGAGAGFAAGWLGMTAGRWLAAQPRLAAGEARGWLDFVGLGLTGAALMAVVAWAARLAG